MVTFKQSERDAFYVTCITIVRKQTNTMLHAKCVTQKAKGLYMDLRKIF